MAMKRRNRKRGWKAEDPPKIASKAEKPASPSEIFNDAEKLASSPNIPGDAEKAAGPSVTLAGADYVTDPGDQFIAAVEEEKPPGPSAAPTGADRRIHPRYEFSAAVELVAAESGARMETRVRDLSQQGCYVDTNNALPLGTVTDVRITKGAQLFEARARVVYSRATKGMGLV